MKTDGKLAAARNTYNAQKSWNKHAFEYAVLVYCDELEREGFKVAGINFDNISETSLIYGRYEGEEYEHNEFDAAKLYLTVNRYNTHYIAKDYKVTTYTCKSHC